ncbi:thioredoxin family protein [Sulfurimonas sp.]|uniref:thioredoxin family protein n=1 Tax=Sulfurimonas sp. TaxID=2022749 RepID=UPI00356914B7
MKIFILTIILLSSLYSYELNWLHNYDEALKAAKKEHKDVYLFVGADECRFCDRFKKLTLSKPEVIDKLQKKYILLYLSRDQHKIPKKFAIKGVPRHYFLTPDGKIYHDDRGSREPAGFFDILDEAELKKE